MNFRNTLAGLFILGFVALLGLAVASEINYKPANACCDDPKCCVDGKCTKGGECCAKSATGNVKVQSKYQQVAVQNAGNPVAVSHDKCPCDNCKCDNCKCENCKKGKKGKGKKANKGENCCQSQGCCQNEATTGDETPDCCKSKNKCKKDDAPKAQ